MKKVVVFFLLIYKRIISPHFEYLFGKACRYNKTCSEYAIEVVDREGLIRGGGLAIKRFASCNPWSANISNIK